jgi:hypothetical protein
MNAATHYIARLYESCVDRGLDLEATRLYLASRGIARTPGQVVYDLDHVFEFSGYSASHPAPAVQSLEEFDETVR